MSNKASTKLSPVLFIPHGGGPLPLLGDPAHEKLIVFLKEITRQFRKPSAILLISAHWEEELPTLTSGSNPEIIYDYYGFPDEAYEVKYPARGDIALAQKACDLINVGGINAKLDAARGFDHGLFVPLKLMYPEADIPCVQLSLCRDMDPASHMAIGRSLAALREENVLIVGSGLSFHNMGVFFSPSNESQERSVEFADWLVQTCVDQNLTDDQRHQRLLNWLDAPSARFCHPREEHLLPLHVCYGIAAEPEPIAELVFNQDVLGHRVTGLLWQ